MSEAKTPKVAYSEEAGGLVSAVPLCADKDGNLVACDSPEANTQVAAPGVPIPPKLAKRYGLRAGPAARGHDEEDDEEAPKSKVLRLEDADEKPRKVSVK